MSRKGCKTQKKNKKSGNGTSKKNGNIKWVITIVIWTFILSVLISFITSVVMGQVSLEMAFIVLIFIILLGIIFDVIGIAVAVASEVPVHSMAARRVPGSRQTIMLIKNADRVSNFCNDVVGDISGIVSGATSAAIVSQIARAHEITDVVFLGLIITGLVASTTVGGKALGKSFAISKSNHIVYRVGLILFYIERFFISGKLKKGK